MSNRQRIYRTRAVILRRRNQGDADRILTLFTPESGKQEVIAKGVRKTTSRKAGHLELLTHTSLLLAQARTWHIITEAVTVESFRHLRQHLDAIGAASYICELIDCFTEADDDSQPLWELLLTTLRALDEQSASVCEGEPLAAEVLLRWFELHLLSLTGFQPQLFHCVRCYGEIEPVVNYFSLIEGGVLCPRCALGQAGGERDLDGYNQSLPGDAESIEPDVLKVMRFLQSQPLAAVRRLSVRTSIEQRVRNLLYRYLLAVIERQLKSVDVVRRLEAALNSAAPTSIATTAHSQSAPVASPIAAN